MLNKKQLQQSTGPGRWILDVPGTDFTIQVTPIYSGKNIQLCTSRVEDNKFTVFSNNGNVEFFWIVYGKRTHIEIEPDKNKVDVKGNGPYKWI